MDKITLKAEERTILGKKVSRLRRDGILPGHVYGNKVATEHVSVRAIDFKKVYDQAGETGLVELRIGAEKVRPVLIRDVQTDPVRDEVYNIDFYQVDLKVKVEVPVPLILIGEQPELVHTGEAVVIQPMTEVQVEALPMDLPEKIEVDITSLKQIDDAILVSQLPVPAGVTILAEPDAVVAKLDTAITAEMEKLMEEQAAEAAAVAEATTEGEAPAEGEEGATEEGADGKTPVAGESVEGGTGEEKKENVPAE